MWYHVGFEKYKSNQNQRALREREQSLLNAILINASLLNMEGSVREVLGKHTVLKKKKKKEKVFVLNCTFSDSSVWVFNYNQFVVTVATMCSISI